MHHLPSHHCTSMLCLRSTQRSTQLWHHPTDATPLPHPQGYFQEMPWAAVPFHNSMARSRSAQTFGVMGIPCFSIVGPDGKLLCKNARGAAAADPEGVNFPWEGAEEPRWALVLLVHQLGAAGVCAACVWLHGVSAMQIWDGQGMQAAYVPGEGDLHPIICARGGRSAPNHMCQGREICTQSYVPGEGDLHPIICRC
jgi:hypothetical protein